MRTRKQHAPGKASKQHAQQPPPAAPPPRGNQLPAPRRNCSPGPAYGHGAAAEPPSIAIATQTTKPHDAAASASRGARAGTAEKGGGGRGAGRGSLLSAEMGTGGLCAGSTSFVPAAAPPRPRNVARAAQAQHRRCGIKPRAFVMLDGEFSGPHLVRHATLAWSLVAFVLPPAATSAIAHQPLPRVSELEVASLTVCLTMPHGTEFCPQTMRSFWHLPANQKVLKWVRKHQQPPASAMQQVSNFLHHLSKSWTLRFIAKPAGVDISRFTSDMCRFHPHPHMAFLPNFSSVCLQSQLALAQRVMNLSITGMHRLLQTWKVAMAAPVRSTHFPEDDCRGQIAEFVALSHLTCLRVNCATPPLPPLLPEAAPCVPPHAE